MNGAGADLRLSVDREKLTDALSQLPDGHANISDAIGERLSKFPDQMADFATRRAPDPASSPMSQIGNHVAAQIAANDVAARLRLPTSSVSLVRPDTASVAEAVKAYTLAEKIGSGDSQKPRSPGRLM